MDFHVETRNTSLDYVRMYTETIVKYYTTNITFLPYAQTGRYISIYGKCTYRNPDLQNIINISFQIDGVPVIYTKEGSDMFY